jgi:addiction module HigA family antidote
MKNPAHPGEVLRDLYLEPLELTVTDAASHLGVARKTLSELLNGHAGISADMAIRLARAFGGSAESWVLMQAHYDLAQAMAQNPHSEIKAFAHEHVPTQSEESAVNA